MTNRVVLCGAMCASAMAQFAGAETARWVNATGGSYQSGSNWSIGATPDASDDLVFDLAQTYTALLDADASANSMLVEAGSLTLDTQGYTLALAGMLTLDPTGAPARLAVTGGGVASVGAYQAFHSLDAELLVEGPGTLFVASTSFIASSDVRILSGGTLTTGGFVIDGEGQGGAVGATVSGPGSLLHAGPINVVDSALLRVENGAAAEGGSLTVNDSRVEITGTGSTLDLGFPSSISGATAVLRIADGAAVNATTLSFLSSSSLEMEGGASLLADVSIADGSMRIVGDASITGDVSLGSGALALRDASGAPASSGRLALDGALTLGALGETRMHIAGIDTDAFSSVRATGDIELDGALHVTLSAAAPLAYGDVFTLFQTDGLLLGDFDSISLTSIGVAGLSWSFERTDNSYSLRVVPTPGGAWLLAIGALGVGRRRRPSFS